jgi:hypothetical protein
MQLHLTDTIQSNLFTTSLTQTRDHYLPNQSGTIALTSDIPSIAGLVPETRTLTINGTTQDLSANRTFTIATGLTVGTTPITSGTVGRVLFEGAGNVLQQSANLFWDNTNNRLGVGTATPLAKIDSTGTIRATGVSAISSGFGIELSYESTVGNIYVYNRATFAFGTLNLNDKARIYSNGNFGIGTSTDAGFRLDVNGTARVQGNITGTGAVTITGAFNTQALSLHPSSGYATFSGNVTLPISGATFTSTSGTQIGLSYTSTFSPTSGTAVYSGFSIVNTINQTGGANGITRGLYINPTLTAAADFRAIETTRGRIVFGNLPTSSAGLPTGAIWNDAGTLKIV